MIGLDLDKGRVREWLAGASVFLVILVTLSLVVIGYAWLIANLSGDLFCGGL